jgi:Tol biopolymer transport system component
MSMMRIRDVALAGLLVIAAATGADAQLPADSRWETIESRHFRVTYETGLQPLAQRAIVTAERAHAALSTLVARPPRGMVDVVIADNVDFSNGYATPFPSNRVVIYAKPPVDLLELQYMADWIDLVVIHELAHTFHLDITGGFGRVLRAVFGRVPFGWPLFPTVFTPSWSIEGLAVAVESALTDYGRLHGSYHEMVVRTAALTGTLDDIDDLTSASPAWPGPNRVYIYGSMFMEYLAREHGPDVVARLVAATADAFIPPPLWFGRVGQRVLGVTFREAYESWQRELEVKYAALAAQLEVAGLTRGEPLTTHRAHALHPRFSPDGASIAYAANDQRAPARLRVLDAATGQERWSRRVNLLAAPAWLPDGTLVTSDLELIDRFRIYSDVFVVTGSERRRLTRGARLQDVHVAADGTRIVAVENAAGTNRLVMLDYADGSVRAVTDFDPAVHWALPRFSPRADRIAVGRWSTGGAFDIVVLDSVGRVRIQVTEEPGISAAPAWSADGRWLLFWSDRTGIPNLYAAEIGDMGSDAAGGPPLTSPLRPRLRQVTNVLTGAYYPDVSPDGRWIAYSAYGPDGFRIERMPFDTAQWRSPLPADHSALSAARGAHVHAELDGAQLEAVRAAAAAADTGWAGPRAYRALRHVRPHAWVPTFEIDERVGSFFGIWSFGNDLVGRHEWDAQFSLAPANGRSQGTLAYTFRGLRAGFVHPTVTLALDRNWDDLFSDTARSIQEREDRALLALALTRQRWRSSGSLSFAGELVRRSRALHGFTPDFLAWHLLREPDDLRGLRLAGGFATYVQPPFAISPENGFSLRLTARQRWDTHPRGVQTSQGIVRRDASYREATGWSAGYLALPLPGFARHVFAVRGSALLRDGPGAAISGVGGVSGAGFAATDLIADLVGTPRLLPVRGFPTNSRTGNRAWTASAEYRLPLAWVGAALRPLPLFVDRIGFSAFADAGHAWCDDTTAARVPSLCASRDAAAPPLLSAGVELTTFLSLYGAALPLRVGAGVPMRGEAERSFRAYVVSGISF